jgi:magnesium chelatase family protein
MVVSKYQKRISGPLLDRIDIHFEVPRVDYKKLSEARTGEPSASVRERVEAARCRQQGQGGRSGKAIIPAGGGVERIECRRGWFISLGCFVFKVLRQKTACIHKAYV